MSKARETNHLKTLGPRAAGLLTELHEKRRTIFSIRDVEEMTGLAPKSARSFAATLARRLGLSYH